MFLRHCELHNYRSWEHLTLDLEPGITLFVGANGQGKTNFIEGINYLSCLRSHRVAHDSPLVQEGCDTATITGTAVNRGRELTVALEINTKKTNQATINTAPCKAREILGIVSTTLFAPEDLNLVRGEPTIRRTYLDNLLIQRRPRLAGVISEYDKVLRQRNALLKSAAMALRHGYRTTEGSSALTTLDAWDAQLAHHGATIVEHRLQLLHFLAPYIADNYRRLAPESRATQLHYQSIPELSVENCGTTTPPDGSFIEAALLAGLAAQRDKEIDRGITLAGPHRDDISLMLGVHPAKGFASQGETWSYALSLRLAAYNLLTEEGTEPILLLDDVFSELDKYRREALAAVVANAEQTLITAAVGDDLPTTLQPVATHTVTARGDVNYRTSHLDSAHGVNKGHKDEDRTVND